MNLEQLAIKHGTDKQIAKGHGYTVYYEKHFESIRNDNIKLLELGVREGWSINMWAEYFPNGDFWGIDNDKEHLCPKSFDNKKINFSIGSQDDEVFLKSVCGENKFNIIIDDCSHMSNLSIRSFEILFPYVKNGGLYIIEDLHVCHLPEYNPLGLSTIEYFSRIKRDDINKIVMYNNIMFIMKRG